MMAQKKPPANKLQCSTAAEILLFNKVKKKYFALCLKTAHPVSYRTLKNRIMVSTIAQIITMRSCIFVLF